MNRKEEIIMETMISLNEYLEQYQSLAVGGLKGSIMDIENSIQGYIVFVLNSEGIEVEFGLTEVEAEEWLGNCKGECLYISGIKLVGSRIVGNFKNTSDLDVLMEYKGELREDVVFNILNSSPMMFEDTDWNTVEVDINPIKAEKTGTIDEWLEHNYL